MFRRIWLYFFPEYMLHVDHAGTKRDLHVKFFTKRSSTHIKGRTVDDKDFEIVSAKPMNYYIEQYKEK